MVSPFSRWRGKPGSFPQTDIPRIAKDRRLLKQIEAAVRQIPTTHRVIQGDARELTFLEDELIHVVVTSPPYWTLKKYKRHADQLGSIENYETFLRELDKVWAHCHRVLVPGGRLICVVGDVCVSRRKNNGRHTVVPLHASIQNHCHLDEFIQLFTELLSEAGCPDSTIHTKATTLPGYFRPTKNWDVPVVIDDLLVAWIECKAHIGPSFGNNFNNRVEEALGNSIDLLTAYREGRFKPSQKPWLGWFMLLEDIPKSRSPVKVDEPHFDVFPEFKSTSYTKRYELFCDRLMRERLYDGTCLIVSDNKGGLNGKFTEPNREFSFATFAASLTAHAIAYAKMRKL